MSTPLFYCSQSCPSLQDCELYEHVWYLRPNEQSHNSQWERADREASASRCCTLLRSAPFKPPISKPGLKPSLPFFIDCYTTRARKSQLRTLTVLHMCFSAQVTFDRASVCQFSCWMVCGPVFWMNARVCAFGGSSVCLRSAGLKMKEQRYIGS